MPIEIGDKVLWGFRGSTPDATIRYVVERCGESSIYDWYTSIYPLCKYNRLLRRGARRHNMVLAAHERELTVWTD